MYIMNFIFLIQARLGSTRRPGKTLTHIKEGTTLLETVYNRVLEAKEATKKNVYVLTSTSPKDDPLVDFMEDRNILYSRGDEQNVFKRFYDFIISQKIKPDYIIRVCCDNPFLEPKFIDEMTDFLNNTENSNIDYLSYSDAQGNPSMATHYGFFCEAISYNAYIHSSELDLTDIEKEHVTPQFYKSGKFSTMFLSMPKVIQDKFYRFTVDTENDLHVVRSVARYLPDKFSYIDVIEIAQRDSEIMGIMAESVIGDKKVGR
jgi:spore coat polysaccharide biosynthesis protein SpsF